MIHGSMTLFMRTWVGCTRTFTSILIPVGSIAASIKNSNASTGPSIVAYGATGIALNIIGMAMAVRTTMSLSTEALPMTSTAMAVSPLMVTLTSMAAARMTMVMLTRGPMAHLLIRSGHCWVSCRVAKDVCPRR